MRKRIWSKYNKSLVQRGSITFLICPKTLRAIQQFKPKSTGGRPREYPLELIHLLLLVKIQYHLTYRGLEGFARSIFEHLQKWFKVPDYTTICKLAPKLADSLPKLSNGRSQVILLDATGVKVYGEGEWKRKIHGPGRPRKWMKVHIAVDEHTQEVVAERITECNVADSAVVEELLGDIQGEVKEVKADGAYDRRAAREAIKKKGAKPLIPPPKNGRSRGDGSERDDALRVITGLGGDKLGRSLWGRLTGYSLRVLVETAFSRYKRIFDGRLFSKTTERQLVENRYRWHILNTMIRTA